MQRQLGDLSIRVTTLESAAIASPRAPPIYGLPGYGGIPALPAPATVAPSLGSSSGGVLNLSAPVMQTQQTSLPNSLPPQQVSMPYVPITQISFPHSPLPIPPLSTILAGVPYPQQSFNYTTPI